MLGLGGARFDTPPDGERFAIKAGQPCTLEYQFTCRFLKGTYYVKLAAEGVLDGARRQVFAIDDATMFTVAQTREAQPLSGHVDVGLSVHRVAE